MKLRVKLDSDPSGLFRVDIGATSGLDELQALVHSAVPSLQHIAPQSLHLSLNKKDVLSSSGTETVQQLGLCGGDTVWVLMSNTPAAARSNGQLVAPAAAAPAPGTSAPTPAVHAHQAEPHNPKKARQTDQEQRQQQQQQQQQQQEANLSSAAFHAAVQAGPSSQPSSRDVAGSSDGMAAGGLTQAGVREEDHEVPVEQLQQSAAQQMPLSLKRVLAAATAAAAAASAAGAGEMQLDTGSAPEAAAAAADPGLFSPHSLLLAAVHAAMLETGFTAMQQASIPLQGPRAWHCTYQWLSAPAAHPSDPAAAKGAPSTCAQPDAPCCRILATPTGPFLTVHATVVPFAPNTSQTLHLDTREYVGLGPAAAAAAAAAAASNASPGQEAPSDMVTEAGEAAAAGPLYADLPQLWLQLQDKVAYWLLSRSFQEAGLPAPLGLLVLPMEIKLHILKQLKARELAAVSGVCSELLHLASADALWSALFAAEFRDVAAADAANAARSGWRGAFGARWRQRREQRLRLEQQRRQPLPPYFRAPPPYCSNPPLMMPPPGFIVGGDYDRLPMPMLGQGPGMFPPRFGFGVPPPSSGPRGGGALGGPHGPLNGDPFGIGRSRQPPPPFGGADGLMRPRRGRGSEGDMFM